MRSKSTVSTQSTQVFYKIVGSVYIKKKLLKRSVDEVKKFNKTDDRCKAQQNIQYVTKITLDGGKPALRNKRGSTALPQADTRAKHTN